MASLNLPHRRAGAMPAPHPAVIRPETRIPPLDAIALGVLTNRMPRGPQDRPTILALDLGQMTGWALRAADGQVTSGTTEFRPGRFQGAGIAFLRFKRWLDELNHRSDPIDAVFFEEVRRHVGMIACHVYGGFLAHLAAWCEHHEVPYEGVPVATIKRFVAGKGNAGKPEVIAAVRKLGHAPADDNEADALAILHWALAHRVGDVR